MAVRLTQVAREVAIEPTTVMVRLTQIAREITINTGEADNPAYDPPDEPGGGVRRLSPGTVCGRFGLEGELTRIEGGTITVFGTPGTATRTTPGTQGSPVSGRQQ